MLSGKLHHCTTIKIVGNCGNGAAQWLGTVHIPVIVIDLGHPDGATCACDIQGCSSGQFQFQD